MLRVLVVEDDPMANKLFSLFVESSKRFKLIAAINNADMTDVYCEKDSVDLIIMDIQTSMHASGLAAAKRVKEKHSQIKILIVTSMPEADYLDRAKKIGVEGFWYKEVKEESFLKILEKIANGEKVFPDSSPRISLGLASGEEFTNRELEVLRLIITGASNVEIAKKLFVTERTVKAHIQNILEKTGFQNRTELAVEAIDSGIVSNY